MVTASTDTTSRDATVHDPRPEAVIGPARLAYFTPVHEQPSLADRKAMFILAASGLLLTVLLFFSEPLERLVSGVGRPMNQAIVLLLVCVVAAVLIAARTAYSAYTCPLPPMPPTLAFFRNVAAAESVEAYAAALAQRDHPSALRDMLHYNYSVACLAAEKFRLVNRALSCLRVAIPLWMLLLLILAVWG